MSSLSLICVQDIRVSGKSDFFKKMFSLLLSALLVLSIFRVPFIEIGFSTLVLLLFTPYSCIKIIKNKHFSCAIPISLYFLYTIFFSNQTTAVDVVTKIVLLIHLVGAFNGTIDFKFLTKSICAIACILTVLVMIQTILYYTLRINLVYLHPAFVLEENQSDVIKQYTISGLYRPSAIFLEPSHYAQFSVVALAICLFYKKDFKKALFIAFGCLLTTSGIGIVACFVAFLFYVLFDEKFKGKRLKIVIASFIVLLVLLAVLYQFNFFRSALQRITGSVDGYNAIEGRLFWWDSTIGSLNTKELLFGVRDRIKPEDLYMTGFMEIIFKHGIVGFILLVSFILFIILHKKKVLVSFLGILYISLMLFANLSSLISMAFWMCVICSFPIRVFYRKKIMYE